MARRWLGGTGETGHSVLLGGDAPNRSPAVSILRPVLKMLERRRLRATSEFDYGSTVSNRLKCRETHRIYHIQQACGEIALSDCPFCDIVSRKSPAEVVFETPHTLAFFPQEPATYGHTMVITKRHIPHFLELPSEDVSELGTTILQVGRALDEVMKPEGMNLITSAGEAASQTVMHLHVHLVPRWHDDALGEIWPRKVSTPEVVLESIADKIRGYLDTAALDHRNPE